jgi:multiple sugar transport system substrate-binding protein
MLDESSIWAGGGHIPAWLPVQKSQSFLKQNPQSNYIQAAFNAVYDPVGWYTGAGSDFQTAVGSVISSVLSGGTKPRSGVDQMTSTLKTFSTARPPVK